MFLSYPMKRLIVLLAACVCVCYSNAQIRFTAGVVSVSGSCNTMEDKISVQVVKSRAEHLSSIEFPDCATCESLRQDFLKGYKSSNCSVRVYATPCCGGLDGGNSNAFSDPNVLGLSQGTSSFSSNPAIEVQDWAEDNEELLKILGGKEPVKHEIIMDNGYVFSAHMPGTITQFVNEDIIGTSASSSLSGVTIPDEYINGNKSFQSKGPWEWYSDDLDKLKIDMKPIDLSDLLADLARYGYEREKTIVLGDIDDIADIGKNIAGLLMNSKVGFLPGALMDIAINLIAEDVKAGYLGYKGEIVDATDIFINTLDKSTADIIGDYTSDVYSEGVVKLGGTGVFGVPVSETHANAGITGVNKVLSIGSIGSSIKSIINRHSNNYDY